MSAYSVEFKHATGGCYCLDLSYREMPAHSSSVEDALRKEIKDFIGRCDGDIMATAWYCPNEETEDQIALRDGETHLIYRRSDGSIMLWSDYRGQASDTKETSDYLAIVTNRATYQGIEPPKEWFSVSVLFKHRASALTLYSVLIAMCREWSDVGMDVDAYAYYGDCDNRLTWKQVRDTDDKFISVHFDRRSKQITRFGKPLPF